MNTTKLCECGCGQFTPLAKKTCFRLGLIKDQPTRFVNGHSHRWAHTQHGFATRKKSPEYRAYISAKGRCNNSQDQKYYRYGGRGIEFRFVSFPEFLACVGKRPSPEVSLDRINNNGHYEKGNVRWATRRQQMRNREKLKPFVQYLSDEELKQEIIRRRIPLSFLA